MDKIFVVDSLVVSRFHKYFVSVTQCATEPDILRNKCQIFRAISEKLEISKVSYFGTQSQIHRTIVHV
jgi:hypothetical protein